MANPNMGAASNIYGGISFDADIDTSASAIVSNAASSGTIVKINSLIISNIDGTNAADITATVRNAAGGTTYSTLANTISVPADATLVVVSKDIPPDAPFPMPGELEADVVRDVVELYTVMRNAVHDEQNDDISK